MVDEIYRDFALGIADGLTVPFAVAAGLVSASLTKRIIVLAVISEIVAGSISMGVAEYIGMDNENVQNDAFFSGVRVGFGYVIGGLIALIPYLVVNDPKQALYASVVTTAISLSVFGYVRSQYLNVDILNSIFKTLVLGGSAATATYVIGRLFAGKE